jgi:phage gpG-like protein
MKFSYTLAGAEKAQGRLLQLGSKLNAAAIKGVTQMTIELEAYVKSQKLSGQVLHVRSGNLRNSVNSQFDGDGTAGSRFTGRVGTGIVYGRIHEFGGVIKRTVQPGVVRLRTDSAGELLRQANHPHLAIFAKASHKRFREVAYEGGKDYTITIPMRSFLRSALAERAEYIKEGIRKAIREAMTS